MLKKRLIIPNWEKLFFFFFVAVAISSRSLSLTWPVDPFAAVAPCLVLVRSEPAACAPRVKELRIWEMRRLRMGEGGE